MSVKKVSDLSLPVGSVDLSPDKDISLRAAGRRFITSYRASNYQESYVRSLEETIAYLSLYSQEQGWPTVPHIATEHLENYFAYIRIRKKGYGDGKVKGEQTLSSSYLSRQYRQLHRFWAWLVNRGYSQENVLDGMKPPRVEEKIVPLVSDEQIADLLSLVNPSLARTP